MNSREIDFVLANLDAFAEMYKEGPLGTIGQTRIADGSPLQQDAQSGAILTVSWTDGEIKKRESIIIRTRISRWAPMGCR